MTAGPVPLDARLHGPLRESHAHLAAHGEALSLPRLDDCTCVQECLARIGAACSSETCDDPDRRWVRFIGARIPSWTEPRWPTLDELNRATGPDRPCVVLSFDHHCALANSAALRAADIRPDRAFPPQGVVKTDPLSGRPTGLLLEQAAHAAWHGAPEPSALQRRAQIKSALAELAGHGFTEVNDMLSQPWLGPLLADLDRAGELPLSVRLFAPMNSLEAMHASRQAWETRRVALAGGKVFADGTLNSGTAWMLTPFRSAATSTRGTPSPNFGCRMLSDQDLDSAIETTGRLGLHLAVHAIGDAAVRACLDAVERRDSFLPRSRVRLEHCELIDEADVPRFASLGVLCSVQPCHLLADTEVLVREMPHRIDRVLPLRDLIDSGCRPGTGLVFGSDVPIVRANPGDSVIAATRRQRDSASPTVGAAQAIDTSEAWACFRAQTDEAYPESP